MVTVFPLTKALKPTPLISSFFTNPSDTPTTMLLSSERPRPCMAFASRSSPSRATLRMFSSWDTLVRLGMSISSLPLGPSTAT